MTRTVLRAAAFLRAGQFALWLWVPVVYGIGRFSAVVLIAYVLAAGWTAVLFANGIRSNGLSIGWVIADVGVAAACAAIVSRFYPPVKRRRRAIGWWDPSAVRR